MKYLYATVAAIAVLTSPSGHAASQASLDVTGFTYQVVDLNPGDNVQPSLAYWSGYVPNYYSNVTTVQTWGSQFYPTYDHAGKGSYTLVQLPAPLVLPALTDSSVWLGGHSSGAIGTDASGNFIHLDAALVGQGYYSATTGADMSGMLSPYTQLTISAKVTSYTAIHGKCASSVNVDPLFCEAAGAQFYVELSGPYGTPATADTQGAPNYNITRTDTIGVPAAHGLQSDVQIVYSNLTDKPQALQFRYWAQVDGYSQMMVPEPGETGLVLSGLAVVAGWLRLRGHAKSQPREQKPSI